MSFFLQCSGCFIFLTPCNCFDAHLFLLTKTICFAKQSFTSDFWPDYAHNVGGELTLILTDEAKQAQGAYHTKITAKRKHQTRMTTHDVALLEAIPGNKGPWTLPPVKTQTQVRPIDRLTKRITAASHFRAHFDTTTTTPNKILADLAKRVPRLKVSQISGGQWWSEKLKGKEFLHRTVKIPTNIANTIIRYSSTWGIFTCKLAFSVSGAMQTNRRPEWSGLSTPEHHSLSLSVVHII